MRRNQISMMFVVPLLAMVIAMAASAVPAAAEGGTYVVRERDTLGHIAVRTGSSVGALVEANGLANADRIVVGSTLVVPDGASDPSVETAIYIVQAGDTLSQIAVRAGATSRELADLNGLSDRHLIRAGEELRVPAANGLSSVGTAAYPNLPDRIISRPERSALIPFFEKWATANDIPVDLLMAVAWQESGWNNGAISDKGATGIGQIMPATGVWVSSDLIGHPELDTANPEDNIRISARFLRWLLDYTGDEQLAIAAYYQGPGSVSEGELFGSTERYVENVQIHRQFFVPAG